MSEQHHRPEPIIVIGAGPVGLAAALFMARRGLSVTVYEARDKIPLSDANSYPIGVNPRGQEALRRIDPGLVERLLQTGETIKGWKIYARARQVASLASGTVVGTTRAFINKILFEATQQDAGINIVFGHKLKRLDLTNRQVLFERTDQAKVKVDGSSSRVIAADGVWSSARRSMAEQLADFVPRVEDWGVRFRVLFSRPGARAPGLDPTYHYIFGDKGIYTATLKDRVWCVTVSAVDGDADEALLTATDATPQNVRALRHYIHTHAPKTAPLLDDADYAAFFARGTFSGAVVRCPFVNADEWLVLLGDAAHSVIPPTGEGVNSGLEDCCYLADQFALDSAKPFAGYNAQRMPDLTALGAYAWYLMENLKTTDPARKAAQVALRILAGLGKKLGLPDSVVEEKLFGPKADCTPYREVFATWAERRDRLFPAAYRLMRFYRKAAAKLGARD